MFDHKSLCCAALAAVAAAAYAPTADAGRAERGDDFAFALDHAALDSADGTVAEYERLDRAIRRYCDTPGRRGVSAMNEAKDCRAVVFRACEAQMPRTLLAHHYAATGRARA